MPPLKKKCPNCHSVSFSLLRVIEAVKSQTKLLQRSFAMHASEAFRLGSIQLG